MTIEVSLRSKRRTKPQPEVDGAGPDPIPQPRGAIADRIARRLALAHHIEHLVEAGKIADYADAARVLGVSRARLSQLMDLLLLPPDIQETVLLGQWRQGERALRRRILSAPSLKQ